MFPYTKFKTLKDHIYKFENLELLKLSAIYGANGAGKSNLIHVLGMLQYLVKKESVLNKLRNGQFKFQKDKESTTQTIVIEFIQEGTPFYYGIEILKGIIVTEELYISGLGVKEDELIYTRKTDEKNNTSIQFLEAFEQDAEGKVIKSVLLKEFVKPNAPILRLLARRENQLLASAKKAYEWFDNTLTVITPDVKIKALAYHIDMNNNLQTYAQNMICAFHVGIVGLKARTETLEDYFGKDNEEALEELRKMVEDTSEKVITIEDENNRELVILKEDNDFLVKELQIEHQGKDDMTVTFDIEEESDGTVRLLDFVPAFKEVVSEQKVYVIDELERSLHPLLIKNLVEKFSLDKDTKGQLIFTTHESNLLDQKIFRQDEIWFAEKDRNGCTDLYSLSKFKEHNTIDIKKGYLNGRYGGIPFLGNLQDLNWHE